MKATSSLYSFLIAASKPIRIGLLAAIKKEYKLEVASVALAGAAVSRGMHGN